MFRYRTQLELRAITLLCWQRRKVVKYDSTQSLDRVIRVGIQSISLYVLGIFKNPVGPEKDLLQKTICMDAIQGLNGGTLHYNVHSLYGWSQSKPTQKYVYFLPSHNDIK